MKGHWICRTVALLFGLTSCFVGIAQAGCGEVGQWGAWQTFKAGYLSAEGRIVDRYDPAKPITTSEGQAYALFFALVAGDQGTFDRLLTWTENNLAGGAFEHHLPAWLWGPRTDGTIGVVDDNSASDADLWMGYTLDQAGRLWDRPDYAKKGRMILNRILTDETARIPGLGLMVLPGRVGFKLSPETWKLNASYLPLPLLSALSERFPGSRWTPIYRDAQRFLLTSTPQGMAPDWSLYNSTLRQFYTEGSDGIKGSYDAIRVYLWAGMLPDDGEGVHDYQTHWQPFVGLHDGEGRPVEIVDAVTGSAQGGGPAGFSSALIPLLKSLGQDSTLYVVRAEELLAKNEPNRYYDWVLTLFGLGWYEGYFHFTNNGQVNPSWTCVAH